MEPVSHRRRRIEVIGVRRLSVVSWAPLLFLYVAACGDDHESAGRESSKIPEELVAMGEQQWQSAVNAELDFAIARAERAPNFVGSAFDYAERRLIFYGVGDPASDAAELIEDPPPVVAEIAWVKVPFTRADLNEAKRTALQELPGAQNAGWERTLDGVHVGVCKASEDRLRELQRLADGLSEVPMRVHQGCAVAFGRVL